jgi:hypothetical protein
MKTRTDLLNFLAEKYDLQRYLEIGIQVPELNFHKIKCPSKVGVDPAITPEFKMNAGNGYNLFRLTSDDYFAISDKNGNKFDLVFIDGLHTAEQVKKDFENALKVLSPNGFIVLHDCNPLKEEHTIVPRPTERGHWNGDVYKFAILITSKYVTNDRAVTVDIDNGMVVYRAGQDYHAADLTADIKWADFDTHRKELLNLISWDEFINSHTHV